MSIFMLLSMIIIIKDTVVINQLCQASSSNEIQCKVDIVFKNFASSKFTKSCKDRPTLKS